MSARFSEHLCDGPTTGGACHDQFRPIHNAPLVGRLRRARDDDYPVRCAGYVTVAHFAPPVPTMLQVDAWVRCRGGSAESANPVHG